MRIIASFQSFFVRPRAALSEALTRFSWTGSKRRESALVSLLNEESRASRRLCLATIEALVYAVEARTPANIGHLERMQAYVVATGLAWLAKRRDGDSSGNEAVPNETSLEDRTFLDDPEGWLEGLRAATLLHDIGRLGVPENILSKEGELTREERDKMRAYPVLGGRILGAVPFPWPVVSIVRHHQEHWSGEGYPDGLSGQAIPLGARILAVADAYDSLVSPRRYRSLCTHETALEELRRAAGIQFDPEVVEAFCSVIDSVRIQQESRGSQERNENVATAQEIARAQREMQSLYDLVCSFTAALSLKDTLSLLTERIHGILNSAACVVFLLEENGEVLRAEAAVGANQSFFTASTARVGTYLTGRVVSRGETAKGSFLTDDVELTASSDLWMPLRSTLVAPLKAEGQVIGTLNLYHTDPNAFCHDDQRLMSIVGELAGRAIANARLFTQTQETAYTDALTGLRNARFLRHFLEQEINRARKNDHSLAVLGMDLNGFKAVNDTLGHEQGDEVLCGVSRIFAAQVRNYDLVVRQAGDEFVIVLPETDRLRAEIVAEKVKLAVEAYADWLQQTVSGFPRIGVSIGIALFPEDGSALRELLSHADLRMYDEKRSGKARQKAA